MLRSAATYALIAAITCPRVSHSYDWDYQDSEVAIPLDILNPAVRREWIQHNKDVIAALTSVPLPTPIDLISRRISTGPSVYEFRLEFSQDDIFSGDHVGGVLALPEYPDETRPLVIAIHGHEEPHRGDPPTSLFAERHWMRQLVDAGFAVWAPSHLLYEQATERYSEYGFHAVWTQFILIATKYAEPLFPPHAGYSIAGVSSGGVSGAMLLSRLDDVQCAVFAASTVPLEYLRRNYRSKNGINQWDVQGVYSYLPFFLYGRTPVIEFQIGRTDPFFPNGTALAPHGGFRGTPRDVLTEEILGPFLILKAVREQHERQTYLHIHARGHEMDTEQLLARMRSETCTK